MKNKDMVSQIGLDNHKKFSKATARDRAGKIVWRQRLDHRDRQGLRHRLAEWPKGTPVILEASFGWSWMSDELQDAELHPHLANTKKVAGWRKARGLSKSDRSDADLLSELWSQKEPWWKVWLAPPQVRQRREWLRYRVNLVGMQTALKNRIQSILHYHGILHEYSDLFGVQGRRFLNLLISDKDITLAESARASAKGYLQLLDHVRRQIAKVTRRFRREVTKTPAARRLTTIPGIGWILAYTILAEIGDIKRFRNAKHLASYCLLVPRAHDSGKEGQDDQPMGRHVGRVGRRTLKWAFIEAAHGAVRKGGRFRALFDRRTNQGKRDRNRGYIAVAHELARLVYVLLTKETNYMEQAPQRPGSRTVASRPEAG